MKRFFLFAGIEAIGLLLCQADTIKIIGMIITCFLVTCVICIKAKVFMQSEFRYLHKENIVPDVVITLIFMMNFFYRWISSYKVAAIAARVHLPEKAMLLCIALLLGFMAIHAIDSVFSIYKYYVICDKNSKLVMEWANDFPAFMMISIIQYLLLFYSTCPSMADVIKQNIVVIFLNAAYIMAFNLFLYIVIRRKKVVYIISTLMVTVWSIGNYYVIKFHGSPLYFSEFANTMTAVKVMSGYKFGISKEILVIAVTALALFLAIMLLGPSESEANTGTKGRVFGTVVLFMVSTLVCFGGYKYINPGNTTILWSDDVKSNGFMIESVRDYYLNTHPVVIPDGYDENLLNTVKSDSAETGKRPDIILILNESFCDIGYSVDIKADVDYMDEFRNIEGAIYGHAVSPNSGGGTSLSEFELLTSKSRYLLNCSTPLVYLSKEMLERSFVKYLKDCFGYETIGMHCYYGKNYSRDVAYPRLGFDEVYLDPENYLYQNSYGNRKWLDIDNYQDLIDHYEACDEDPRFMYMLTYQNHGSYEQNDSSLDTVHVENDFGEYTDDVNEFLSSISLSGEAFHWLTDYFKTSSRDVIICMVGDHAPSFITSLPHNKENPLKNDYVVDRIVPYVIWSNFEMDDSFYTEYATMTDLVPMILKAARMPKSAFYKALLELHEEMPIRTKEGQYYDREFIKGTYGASDSDQWLLNRYYFMEYNSFLPKDNYKDELFMCH